MIHNAMTPKGLFFILLTRGSGKDSIVFRRTEYHANGSFLVQEIVVLKGTSLWQSCKPRKYSLPFCKMLFRAICGTKR